MVLQKIVAGFLYANQKNDKKFKTKFKMQIISYKINSK